MRNKEMVEEVKIFFKAWLMVVASLCYCYFIPSKLPKGVFRLFSLLPIFSLFTLLPYSLSRPIPIAILSWLLTWLANFKLLLYSFNLGLLPAQKTLIKFIIFAAFPIKIKSPKFERQPKVLPLNFGSKCLVSALLIFVCQQSQTPNWVALCCLMCLFLDIVFGVCDLIVKGTLGWELEPPSNEPYLSTSLQDFWGRRWNRMISDVLRDTIFYPVRSAAGVFVGPRWAPGVAVMATFVVSGLLHELFFHQMTRVRPTWEVTWFFVLHGVCLVLEMEMKRALGRRLRLHWAVSGPLTVGFVLGTSYWLFYPQIARNHVDIKAIEDVIAFGNLLMEMVRMSSRVLVSGFQG